MLRTECSLCSVLSITGIGLEVFLSVPLFSIGLQDVETDFKLRQIGLGQNRYVGPVNISSCTKQKHTMYQISENAKC